jgi:peptidoglycan/xylan/chitin deacetylase (PgdA/CDA1 family)
LWAIAVMGLCTFPALAFAQSVALSFDDGFDPQNQPQAALWNQAMLDSLAKAKVKSIVYVAGRRVDSPAGLQLVEAWGRAGHEVANHTYNHPNLNKESTTLEAFVADIEKNETLLSAMPGWTRRFRFPYLKEGDTAAKRDGIHAWLGVHNYKSGAVSIDASDWYFDQRYAAWRKTHPADDASALKNAYLEHLWGRAVYYDGLSQKVLNRSAKHVLLLHLNRINAEFLPDIVAMFRSKGWKVISSSVAYRDPLYAMKPDVLPAGESILWALAKQKSLPDLRYPAEDGVYEKETLDRLGF